MTPDLQARCTELLARGRVLAVRNAVDDPKSFFCFISEVSDLRAWIASVMNLVLLSAMPDSYFIREATRIREDTNLASGVPRNTVRNLLGLLAALEEEMKLGLLRKAEYIYVATTFDDFLGHASDFHRAGKKIESAVLCSAVFEDSVRKLADKVAVPQAGVNLDMVIDALAKQGATTPIKAKRWKSFAGIRNSALHAQWEGIDLRDVGQMIEGTGEIIESL